MQDNKTYIMLYLLIIRSDNFANIKIEIIITLLILFS